MDGLYTAYTAYTGFKWGHIVGICIGFGSNVTHIFWLISANVDDTPGKAEKLRVVKKIDDFLAVPAYAFGIGCGITMWIWNWPLDTSWIVVSLVLSTILTVLGICFGPFMKRWIALAGEEPGSERLEKLSKRLTYWWMGLVAWVFVVLYLMVFKPTFW